MSKSVITTHILDTSSGFPAANVPVSLFQKVNADWLEIATGKTNDDGRITDWLTNDKQLPFGIYKVSFDLDDYYKDAEPAAFYPIAEVVFRYQDNRHHHIPLLLTPFGYSTYRGS